jgi:hypothetical protein
MMPLPMKSIEIALLEQKERQAIPNLVIQVAELVVALKEQTAALHRMAESNEALTLALVEHDQGDSSDEASPIGFYMDGTPIR